MGRSRTKGKRGRGPKAYREEPEDGGPNGHEPADLADLDPGLAAEAKGDEADSSDEPTTEEASPEEKRSWRHRFRRSKATEDAPVEEPAEGGPKDLAELDPELATESEIVTEEIPEETSADTPEGEPDEAPVAEAAEAESVTEDAEVTEEEGLAEDDAQTEAEDPEEIEELGEESISDFRAPAEDELDAKGRRQAKDLKKLFKDQRRLAAQREMAKARELERQAKELHQKAKEKQKIDKDIDKHEAYVREISEQLGLDPDRPITPLPQLPHAECVEVEFTEIKEDRSYIRIIYDKRAKVYEYQIIEPELLEMEADVLRFLKDTLYRTLEGRFDVRDETDWSDVLSSEVDRAIIDHRILVDEISKERVKYYIIRDFLGYGAIDVMMHDPMIEDISCDGPSIPVYIFHRQYESIRTNLTFRHEADLDSFVIRLAQISGKHISLAEPLLDATLPDTSRLQCTLSKEVTTRGSSFTIRRFRSDPLTSPDLIRLGTVSAELAAFFWMAMEMGHSVIYAGGTASGKTTSLNAICQFIPPEKKIVSIEDTREINLRHENWIAGVSRPGYRESGMGGKAGAIDMYRLLEAALRQRPEFLLVGEVRGVEAKTLFQAMATGHATYSTLHADSVMSAVYRLENPPISIPRIMLQTLDIVAIQVQARIGDRMVRRVKELTEIVGIHPESGDLVTNTVFKWDVSKDKHVYLGSSHTLRRIMELKNLKREEVEGEWQQRTRILQYLADEGIRHIDEVAEVLRSYYRNPEDVLIRLNVDEGLKAE